MCVCVCVCVCVLRVTVVLDEVTDGQVVADLGKVHGGVLVFGEDVAVGAVLQQEAHYVCVPPLTGLGRSEVKVKLSDRRVHYLICCTAQVF